MENNRSPKLRTVNKSVPAFPLNDFPKDFPFLLGKEIIYLLASKGKPELEGSDWERVSMTNQFGYSLTQSELMDFADWLTQFLTSDRFYRIANKFIEIEHRLKTEPVGSTRTRLVSKRYSLLEEYK